MMQKGNLGLNMKEMEVPMENIFEQRRNKALLNTSYPLKPVDWAQFKSAFPLPFDMDKDVCFYIHVPFCRSLCKFCEYIRFKSDNGIDEERYLDILEKDIDAFLNKYPNLRLRGFDIGGGTPTALSLRAFERLLQIYRNGVDRCNLSSDFLPSIEATFSTLDKDKIRAIATSGIKRISLGIQSANTSFLLANHRYNGSLAHMSDIFAQCRKYGVSILNIDLMYGFLNQSDKDLTAALAIVSELLPEHLTIYELRTNMLNSYQSKPASCLFKQYEFLFNHIMDMGYKGRFGQNTFSRANDMGVSSYLQNRMTENCAYKGFGIAAQSKSSKGLSYNIGKNGESLTECLQQESFECGDVYILPRRELLSKYIAICGYCGMFKLSKMEEILGENPLDVFHNQFKFLFDQHLIKREEDIIYITHKGFRDYGAVLSLFHQSNKSI